ncbi:MAG: hypothetical protein Q8P17_04595 [bacterium]|nr:hypothetical protein [bacterium]
MLLTITITSILAITLSVWLANRILPFTVCPICAGVFLTWVGLVGAYFFGYTIDLRVPAILMGGSVVGIAYQLEKKFHGQPQGARMLWKVLFMPAGFVAVYAVLNQWWGAFLFAAAFLAALAIWLISSSGRADSHEETVQDIEKSMKDCC